MNREQHRIIIRYTNKVKRELPYTYSDKNHIIMQLSDSLNTYADEHPDFIYDNLIRDFGLPAEYANSIIEYESPEHLKTSMFRRKHLLIIIIIIVLITFATLTVIKYKSHLATSGYEVYTAENDSNADDASNPNEEIIEE